jgi:Tfp pilus assembly protein PilO
MTLSDRDRKIVLIIVPALLVAVYWFMLLAPKRQEASKAAAEATEQTERLEGARARARAADGAQTDFAADYAEIVRLGKAIPSNVDMPSLLVQLDSAAAGTGIRFTRIATGDREPGAAAAAPAPAPSGGTPAAAAGGQPAQSAPGTAVENANETAQAASQQSDAATQSGVDPSDTQTSESSGSGLPVGGGAPAGDATGTTGGSPAGLETVPLELEFVGNFFSLADFFHDIKRFVRERERGRERAPDHRGRRALLQRHGPVPADHRRGHRHRLPLAEGAGDDGRRHPGRPRGAAAVHAGEPGGPRTRHAQPCPDRHRDPLRRTDEDLSPRPLA